MAKVYMFRHQHAGIVTSHVFSSPPTDEQLAPIKAECARLHGRDGWGAVHEAEFVTTEVPTFPERQAAGSTDNAAAASAPSIQGSGTVTSVE